MSATNTGSSGGVAGWLPGALAGGGDGPLADGFGVGGGHAEAVASEGFAQRRPGGAELGGGGVDAAELFGELEGAFGLGAVGEKALGCQPTSLLGMQGPLVGVGEGSISLRRWLTAYRVLRKAGALMRQSGSVRALP